MASSTKRGAYIYRTPASVCNILLEDDYGVARPQLVCASPLELGDCPCGEAEYSHKQHVLDTGKMFKKGKYKIYFRDLWHVNMLAGSYMRSQSHIGMAVNIYSHPLTCEYISKQR